MSKPQFNPTQEQILAAMDVMMLKVLVSMTKEAFAKFEQQILDAGDYPVDVEKWKPKANSKRNIIELLTEEGHIVNGMVKNYKSSHMIQGLDELCSNPNVSTESNPCAKYYSELARLAADAGYIHRENALCRLENALSKAEQRFGKLAESLSGGMINFDDIILMEHRKKFLDLSLSLLAPLVDKHPDREIKQRKMYAEHFNHFNTPSVQDEVKKLQELLNQ